MVESSGWTLNRSWWCLAWIICRSRTCSHNVSIVAHRFVAGISKSCPTIAFDSDLSTFSGQSLLVGSKQWPAATPSSRAHVSFQKIAVDQQRLDKRPSRLSNGWWRQPTLFPALAGRQSPMGSGESDAACWTCSQRDASTGAAAGKLLTCISHNGFASHWSPAVPLGCFTAATRKPVQSALRRSSAPPKARP